jgi:hypothetical protein
MVLILLVSFQCDTFNLQPIVVVASFPIKLRYLQNLTKLITDVWRTYILFVSDGRR